MERKNNSPENNDEDMCAKKEDHGLPYPAHGVIGTSEPAWLNVFHGTPTQPETPKQNFKKQKYDFHKTYESEISKVTKSGVEFPTPIPGLHNLWTNFNEGVQRSSQEDMYPIDASLPNRFKNPDTFHGYGCERNQQHPSFTTTSSDYGQFPPTRHDVPREYHGVNNSFTTHLATTGMPKNRSLNI